MEIKQVGEHTYDVFWGTNWNNWCRIQTGKKEYWKIISGKRMPKDVFSEFKERIGK